MSRPILVKTLLALWIGTLPAPAIGDELTDAWLSAVAQTPIRVFDPRLSDVDHRFESFISDALMVNGRRVPGSLASDVAARVRLQRGLSAASAPTYFVASYIDRLQSQLASDGAPVGKYRYGEPIYPQAVCPVFATHSDASVPYLLATATGLPAALFVQAPGERDRLHTLFLLTEASHCAFLARELGETALRPVLRSRTDLVSLIEAIGDIEAIDAFRKLFGASAAVDEGDVLLAARIVALFASRKQNVYSIIPAVAVSAGGQSFATAAREVASHQAAVATARQAYRSITGKRQPAKELAVLLSRAQAVRDALAADGQRDLDPTARTLLALFPPAVQVLAGAPREIPMVRTQRAGNRTLPGADRGAGTQNRMAAVTGPAVPIEAVAPQSPCEQQPGADGCAGSVGPALLMSIHAPAPVSAALAAAELVSAELLD